MDIKVRVATEKDLEKAIQWYGGTRCVGVPIVATIEDIPVACGYMIPTYFEMCLFEFIKVDKSVSIFKSGRAVKALIKSVIQLAKDLGFTFLMGFVDPKDKSIKKEFIRNNCIISSIPFQSVTRRLYG